MKKMKNNKIKYKVICPYKCIFFYGIRAHCKHLSTSQLTQLFFTLHFNILQDAILTMKKNTKESSRYTAVVASVVRYSAPSSY